LHHLVLIVGTVFVRQPNKIGPEKAIDIPQNRRDVVQIVLSVAVASAGEAAVAVHLNGRTYRSKLDAYAEQAGCLGSVNPPDDLL
jgi:hypothetical protein